MDLPPDTKTTTKHAVAVYFLLGVGLIVGAIVAVAYLFTGQ